MPPGRAEPPSGAGCYPPGAGGGADRAGRQASRRRPAARCAEASAGLRAAWLARELRLGERATARLWAETIELIDHMGALVPELTLRPRLVAVPWSGGRAPFVARATCCLSYRTPAARRAQAGSGEPCLCSSCPLRSDGARAGRLATWLEERAAG